jgi:hypothetical protein
MDKSSDQDRGKGAGQNPQNQREGGNTSIKDKLGQKNKDTEFKNPDSDLAGSYLPWPTPPLPGQ